MPLKILLNDITKMQVDAIVNAANRSLLGGSGVDGCIHRAAGPSLFEECVTLGGCETGSAKITGAGRLPCKYVIHAVGPQWWSGIDNEKEKLISCYKASLELARQYNCRSVAFPLISSGIYRYPKDQALNIAIDTIGDFLLLNNIDIYIVILNSSDYKLEDKLYNDISSYIDQNLTDNTSLKSHCSTVKPSEYSYSKPIETLLYKADSLRMSKIECCRKANLDDEFLTSISTNSFRPQKNVLISLSVALKLSIEETVKLLSLAGYSLLTSDRTDIIARYFIANEIYNAFKLEQVLFAFEQARL